jgi:hypothetical protein
MPKENRMNDLSYSENKKSDKERKAFLMGIQWAAIKAANERAKALLMQGMVRNTEADAKEQKVTGMMQNLSGMQDQFSEHLNNAPLPQINPMAGLPPAGAMPPLPQQNTAPAF